MRLGSAMIDAVTMLYPNAFCLFIIFVLHCLGRLSQDYLNMLKAYAFMKLFEVPIVHHCIHIPLLVAILSAISNHTTATPSLESH